MTDPDIYEESILRVLTGPLTARQIIDAATPLAYSSERRGGSTAHDMIRWRLRERIDDMRAETRRKTPSTGRIEVAYLPRPAMVNCSETCD